MIKDKLIPLGLTFTIIAGAVGCDIANDKPVEETPVVEVEEPIKTFTQHTVRGSKEVISLMLFVVAPK